MKTQTQLYLATRRRQSFLAWIDISGKLDAKNKHWYIAFCSYLVRARLPNGASFTAYTYAGELPSCAFGFNSNGIVRSTTFLSLLCMSCCGHKMTTNMSQAFTLNSVPPRLEEIIAGGIGRNLISRDLLEATSLEDSLDVRHVPHEWIDGIRTNLTCCLIAENLFMQHCSRTQLQFGRCNQSKNTECWNSIKEPLLDSWSWKDTVLPRKHVSPPPSRAGIQRIRSMNYTWIHAHLLLFLHGGTRWELYQQAEKSSPTLSWVKISSSFDPGGFCRWEISDLHDR